MDLISSMMRGTPPRNRNTRRPLARRTDIEQIMRAAVHAVKQLGIQLDAELMRNRRHMDERVGGAGDRRMHHDGVLERLARDDITRLETGLRKTHDLLARAARNVAQVLRRWRA